MQVERTDLAPSARLAEIEARYRAIAAQLAGIGFIARGSVVAAMTTCSSRGCHCRTNPARRHGPYWQLSRSSGGTTRTEAILAELEELSSEAAALVLWRAAEEAPDPAK